MLLFHCCAILPYKGKRMRKICQRITLYNPGLTGFLLEDEPKTKCSAIIDLLFGVLVDDTCGHFADCFYFSGRAWKNTRLEKILRNL